LVINTNCTEMHGQQNIGKNKNSLRCFQVWTILDYFLSCLRISSYSVSLQTFCTLLMFIISLMCRSRWPRGLKRGSAATGLFRLWVWIPPGAWRSLCFECCVLPDRGLCVGLITRSEESYWLCCFFECDLKKLLEWGGPDPLGVVTPNKKKEPSVLCPSQIPRSVAF
jgi:hypothetical protein